MAKVEIGRLSDRAYARLREAILDGSLTPGSVIQEADLVRRLNMSRTPVREALRRLEADSLVETIPQRGYLVIELTRDEIVDVYAVREVLEALAARLAAKNRTRVDLAQLEELWDAMTVALNRLDDTQLAKLNGDFHDAVAHASRNSYLEAALARARTAFQRYRPAALTDQQRRREAHREHRALLDAIAAGDSALAATLASQHVAEAAELRLFRQGGVAQGANDGLEPGVEGESRDGAFLGS